MRLHQIPALLLALATTALCAPAAAPIPDITGQFQGQGKIVVINGTFDASVISEDTKLGCLGESGILTKNDCAIFTLANGFPNSLSTSAGDCTFQDTRMPQNKESYYGADTHAWFCGDLNDAWPKGGPISSSPWVPIESFYTVVSTPSRPDSFLSRETETDQINREDSHTRISVQATLDATLRSKSPPNS